MLAGKFHGQKSLVDCSPWGIRLRYDCVHTHNWLIIIFYPHLGLRILKMVIVNSDSFLVLFYLLTHFPFLWVLLKSMYIFQRVFLSLLFCSHNIKVNKISMIIGKTYLYDQEKVKGSFGDLFFMIQSSLCLFYRCLYYYLRSLMNCKQGRQWVGKLTF